MASVVTNDNLKKTLSSSFFERNTVQVARELLGTLLCRRLEDGTILSGMIVETEAYTHDDPACHAYRGKTTRCEVMFGPGGYSYVYFIYGMYFCLNVVTEADETPGAVLIRAIEFDGANGPGKLCRQWGIDRSHNGVNLMDWRSPIWLAQGSALSDKDVEITKRIGLSVAQDQLWRFTAKGHPSVSGQKRSSGRSRIAKSPTSQSKSEAKSQAKSGAKIGTKLAAENASQNVSKNMSKNVSNNPSKKPSKPQAIRTKKAKI